MESLAEVRGLIVEDNMDLMRKAAAGAMQTIKMKDGKLQMDSFTASAIMQVYDKVNPANKKKIETIINSGKKNQIMKLQSMAMKAIKSEYGEETDLDEAKGTTKYVVMQGPGDNNQKVIATFDGGPKALEKAKKFRDDWNKKNKSKIKLDKKGKPIAAHMARIFDKGVETSYKVGDKVSYSAFAPSIIKDEVDLEEGRMKELHGYIAQGKSAEWIAKKM